MNIIHLTASARYGGPERQMLGLARGLGPAARTAVVSFAEGGRCRAFLEAARRQGVEAVALDNDTPRLRAATRELTRLLAQLRADVVLCHGYKANLLGRSAARRLHIPAVAVARGWTGESLRVRLYEALDRWHLRWMDRVVCVSQAQASRVLRAGVHPERVRVIHNAVDPERFSAPDPRHRDELCGRFKRRPARLVGAAGRLSPEKGFEVFVAAAGQVSRTHPEVGFVLFGDGPRRERILRQVQAAGLSDRFALAGFRDDLDCYVPHLDLFVLPSYTEGLPNVVLEACAASVPVVATAVGGTPEILRDGAGLLVAPGDATALADTIAAALGRGAALRALGEAGHSRVRERFTFAAQARRYQELLYELCPHRAFVRRAGGTAGMAATARRAG
jgi:glycosyltransferase involved in cell wall biosynthesis